MEIQMFNFWYFFWSIICLGSCVGLYFILKNRTVKTQKTVLFSLLVFGFILHFLKMFFPPYSTNQDRLYRDIWFINICAANIAIFPFIYFSKNNHVKDYMFYIGVISGIIAVLVPIEPIQKVNQTAEILDIIRFYIHHSILFIVPLLTVLLKHHKLSYKRVWVVPTGLLLLMLFIMLNQIFQSELGFVPLRGDDIFDIGYKNTSYIWGPDDQIGKIFSAFCPDFFKTIPVGEFAGQQKYWPWFWLIFPAYIILTPLSFGVSLIFDFNNFKNDVILLKNKIISKFQNKGEEL